MFEKAIREFKRRPKIQQIILLGAIALLGWWLYKKYVMKKEGFDNSGVQATVKCTLYYTDWCPHCQKIKPDWEMFQKQFDGQTLKGKTVIVVAVNGDEQKEAAQAAGVTGYPTITFSKNGAPAMVYKGDRSFDGFKKYLMQI